MENLVKKLSIFEALNKVKDIEPKFYSFLKKNVRNPEQIEYKVVYSDNRNRIEIKRKYGEDFTENGPIPENHKENWDLISHEFSDKYKVHIDYFLRLDLVQKMNPKRITIKLKN